MTRAVILLRKDLDLSPGKVGVQCAHAMDLLYRETRGLENLNVMRVWQRAEYKKIVLWVDDETELRRYHHEALLAGLPAVLVYDIGLKEFHKGADNVGRTVFTACGIGPALDEVVMPLTHKLQLVK